MRGTLPMIFLATFISLSLFYYFNQKAKIIREERRDRLNEKHQKYLDSLVNDLSKEN